MTITDVAGLEALPERVHIVDAEGYEWFKIVILPDTRPYFHAVTGPSGNYRPSCVSLPAEVLSPRTVTPEQAQYAFRDFIDSFNDDEAGTVEPVGDVAGNTGFVPAGGNDMWHVFLKALAAMGIEVSDG